MDALSLHPIQTPDGAPACDAVEQLLHALGLAERTGTGGRFHTGPAFLDHLSFIGCSPVIARAEIGVGVCLDPDDPTRLHIDIAPIHPYEAVPTDALLDALGSLGCGPWTYCYRSIEDSERSAS